MVSAIEWRPVIFALLAAVALAGCFEDPVTESLVIEILPNDRAKVVARTEITGSLPPENQAASDRVTAVRTDLTHESDQWSVLFRTLRPLEERYIVEKVAGELRTVERSAIVYRTDLENFFRATSIGAFVVSGDGWSELTLYPGESTRATRQQRDELADRLDLWSRTLARYFDELARVTSYLEQRPDRQRAIWAAVFEDMFDEPEPELTQPETDLIERLKTAIERTWSVFEIEGEQAYSLQQIGYLVYDPFPSDLAIEVPGRVIESEGFERKGQRLEIERVGLWEAFETLRDRIVANDPLEIWMSANEDEESASTLDSFLLTPVEVMDRPSAEEIGQMLKAELTPSTVYRVRWRE